MLLNVLFLIGCIPVVSIGASMAGLYSVSMKMVANKEGSISKQFFKAWKGSFMKGLAFELIFGAAFAVIVLGLEVIRANPDALPWLFNAVYLLAIFLVCMLYCWTWPLEASFENSILNTLKNAFLMGITNLVKTLIVVIISLIPLAVLFLAPKVFLATGVIWLLFGFSGIAILNSILFNKALKRYLEPEAASGTQPEEKLPAGAEEETPDQPAENGAEGIK